MNQLQPGDAAPAFSALDQHGSNVDLSDFKGRRVFVFFYPKANTSG
jgi:peroxiredoxin Q/BCP